MVGKDAAVEAGGILTMEENANLVLPTLCAIANTSKARMLPYKSPTLKLSIEALTPAKLGQLDQDLENMSRGGTIMAASVWVSQQKVDY
jgi:hypothetical protein